jgi:hypothetical protein
MRRKQVQNTSWKPHFSLCTGELKSWGNRRHANHSVSQSGQEEAASSNVISDAMIQSAQEEVEKLELELMHEPQRVPGQDEGKILSLNLRKLELIGIFLDQVLQTAP